MNEHMVSNIPVVDEEFKFLGTASMKDIARDMISGNQEELEASYENILKTVNGVGVNINTASSSLLSYVSGLNKKVIKELINKML